VSAASVPLSATITGLPSSGHSPEGTQLTLGAIVTGGASGADTYSWTVTRNGVTGEYRLGRNILLHTGHGRNLPGGADGDRLGQPHGLGHQFRGSGRPGPDGDAGRAVLGPAGVGGSASRPA